MLIIDFPTAFSIKESVSQNVKSSIDASRGPTVDFPLPDCPTNAIVFPFSILNERFLITSSVS